jgi:Ser/Thr protein kinase RdoA (MazF antagonist)
MADPETEDIERLLRDSYGIEEPPREIARRGGTSGASFRIALSGKALFLKCRSPEHAGAEQVRFEHDLLALLHRAGFPVAAPLADRGGNTSVPLCGKVCELAPWIDGVEFTPGNGEQVREAGAALARFHRITADLDRRKGSQDREDDPERLLRELDVHLRDVDTAAAEPLLVGVRDALRMLCRLLPLRVYGRLPQAVIHGDFHPGNAKFAPEAPRLVGLFDFDWANRQERIRDVSDGLLLFCAHGPNNGPADIFALTATAGLDPGLCRVFLDAYEATRPLTAEEQGALPLVMEARWLQMRIRGMRKVPREERLRFLDRGNLFPEIRRIRSFRACL